MMVQVKGVELPRPFRRLRYGDALDRYGSDKPDLRYGLCLYDVTEAVQGTTFRCPPSSLSSPLSPGVDVCVCVLFPVSLLAYPVSQHVDILFRFCSARNAHMGSSLMVLLECMVQDSREVIADLVLDAAWDAATS